MENSRKINDKNSHKRDISIHPKHKPNFRSQNEVYPFHHTYTFNITTYPHTARYDTTQSDDHTTTPHQQPQPHVDHPIRENQ